MSDTKTPNTPDPAKDNGADKKPKDMTAADAAKSVKRFIYGMVDTEKVGADGKAIQEVGIVKRVPVKPEEVLAFKDHGTHVVVVTVDGQKFSSDAE